MEENKEYLEAGTTQSRYISCRLCYVNILHFGPNNKEFGFPVRAQFEPGVEKIGNKRFT